MPTKADNQCVPFDFKKVRRLRDAAGLTMAECARRGRLNGGAQRWNDLETGRYPNPRLDTLEAIAAALRCDISDLIIKRRKSH
jgi:transcriptional regulator with XRE-family HTH domain